MSKFSKTVFGSVLVLVLLLSACAPAATATTVVKPTTAPTVAPPTVVNFYTDSDTNISDWMANVIGPAFEKANPQYKFKMTTVRGIGNGTADIADRALAAMQTNSDPQAEILEMDSVNKPDLVKAGVFLKVDETNVPNSKMLLKGIKTSETSTPYRGSQVLLAYDSKKVKEADVPRTFPALIAWIKANPGKFVYCRPDKGGSGGNFVDRAIYEVTGKDPKIFKAGALDPAVVAKFPDAWALLRSIHTSIYDNGSYPAGNNPVLELLANGSVSMATVWSDQALIALSKGVLPDTIKLAQLTDLEFPGGNTMLSIPANTRNKAGALAFLNFMLSSDGQVSVIKTIGGFPAVDWSNLPKELQAQYTSVMAKTIPFWPGGVWDTERNKGWYDNVATNIKQGS